MSTYCTCGHADTNHFSFSPKSCAHCQCLGFIEKPNPLRELRMWHWKQALKATQTLKSKLGSKSSITRARRAWGFHMGAVQTLNDYVSGTAEQDCAKQD